MLQPSRIVLAVLLIGLTIAIVDFYILSPDRSSGSSGNSVSQEARTYTPSFQSEQKQIQVRERFDEQTASAADEFLTWRLMTEDEITETALMDNRPDVLGKAMVELDLSVIKGAVEGDNIKFLLPDLAGVIEVKIIQKTTLPSGNLSVLGKVSGLELLDFVMTMSDQATLATIGTTNGVFSLRGNTKHAWVTRARDYNHHVDPSVPDFRLPQSSQNELPSASSR